MAAPFRRSLSFGVRMAQDGFLTSGIEGVLWALFGIATITDLLRGKIYNTLTFSFLVAGLVARIISQGAIGGQSAGLSLLIAFALYFPLWRLQVLAAGDVKLLMAASVWLSVPETIRLAMLSILFGAAVGLFLRVRMNLKGEEPELKATPYTGTKRLLKMPFAPAFFCAFVFMQIAVLKHWGTWPW